MILLLDLIYIKIKDMADIEDDLFAPLAKKESMAIVKVKRRLKQENIFFEGDSFVPGLFAFSFF